MILTQIYDINKFRLVLWITICIGLGVYPNLTAQADPLSQADQVMDETSQAVQKTEQSVQKLDDQKQKASKFKTFLKDSIPAYTDQFGSYLKQVIERQNRFDYLDEVPKNNSTKRVPKFPQRIANLKAAYQTPSMTEVEWTGMELPAFNQKRREKRFTKEIYGFHSFMDGNNYERYDLNAVTRIGYIGYLIDASTGAPKRLPNWETTNLHKRAVQYQIDIDLVAQLLDSSSTARFLKNEKAWALFADTIIQTVIKHNSSGIVIDFFGVSKKHQKLYLEFVRYMRYRLGEAAPRLQLGICLPPVDPDDAYAAQEITAIADRILIMAMDYQNYDGYTCGPTSPLISKVPKAPSIDETYNAYIKRGVKANKIILVLGLSGQQYAMKQAQASTNDASFFSMIPFATYEEDYCVRFRPHTDENTIQKYISFSSNDQWYITWGENIGSLALKSDYANNKNLKGLGMWQLAGAVSPYSKLWPLLYQKFSIPNSVTESEILNDFALLPQDANIDSILSVNQALIMTAINLTDNPFLPEKPDANQLAKAQTYGFEYKNLLKALGMFFTILTICALLGLAIAMFDEKIRNLFFYDNVYLFIIPSVMILITLTMRLFGLILNSGMEFVIGGLFGLAVHYLFLSYTKKKANIHENTP
jgi:hypothetical protein